MLSSYPLYARNLYSTGIVIFTTMSDDKFIHLQPEWKAFFWILFSGVLLTPVFGVGLLLIWAIHKKRSDQVYEIHNRFIRAIYRDKTRKIDLRDIIKVAVEQRWIDRKLDVGTVELSTNSRSISLLGMDDPHHLAGMIRHAAKAEKKRFETQQKTEAITTDHDPGSLHKMDYLTGLWQQGLISDKEFKKERKHFED